MNRKQILKCFLYTPLLFLLLFSSCQRRPPVVKTKAPVVVEYVPDEWIEREYTRSQDRQDLIAEYFDPYQPQVQSYRVSRGDVLEISVFGNDDTQVSEVVVAPDGRLYYMFLDGIYVEGNTVQEISEKVEARLGDMFVNPEVSVIPKNIASQTYTVLGKVNRPGLYPIPASITLRQAIADAGGIAYGGFAGTTINIADLKNSYLLRNNQKLDIDFEKLLYTDGTGQNIYLRPGDYLYIASSLMREVYVLGQVRSERPIPYKDGLTLMGVLAGTAGATGGTIANADVREVMIVRGSFDAPQVIKADFIQIAEGRARDIYLLPGDVVFVPNKKARFGRELVRAAIETFFRTFGAATGNYYGGEWFNDG